MPFKKWNFMHRKADLETQNKENITKRSPK